MENQPDGITIFASCLHTHLLGREIYAHHYRNNTELPMISKDEHYDFDYQETRHLSDPVVIKPVSISKCNYVDHQRCKSSKELFVDNLEHAACPDFTTRQNYQY